MPKKTSKKAARRSKGAAKPALARSAKKKAAPRKSPSRVASSRPEVRASAARARRRGVEAVPAAYGSVTAQLVVKNAGATTGGIMLYVPDVDTTFARALEAGARATREPRDTFWGDRFGQIEDPFGHSWAMATHVRDVSPADMVEAMAATGTTEA